MHSDAESYDLAELAAAADVTPRTVRYYVQHGLLPSPGTRGPGTRYDQTHLDRLQLIKRLQREHLPLAEIRRRLEGLDERGVRSALAGAAAAPSSALDYVRGVLGEPEEGREREAPGVGAESAPSVRARVARRGWAGGPPRFEDAAAPAAGDDPDRAERSTSPPAILPPSSPPGPPLAMSSVARHGPESPLEAPLGEEIAAAPLPPTSRPRKPAPTTRSQWERIALDPDVELHVRRPLTREQNRRVERLLDAAREIFTEEP